MRTAAQALAHKYETDPAPTARLALSDAYQRLGFLAALSGELDTAQDAITQSTSLRSEPSYLDLFNLAHVRARRGEYSAAAELLREASKLEVGSGGAYMLLYLPAPPDWYSPSLSWHVASVTPSRVADLLSAQTVVYDALAGRFDLQEFRLALDELSQPLGPEELRLIGWNMLTRYGDPSLAHQAMSAAVAAGSAEAELEAQFLRERMLNTAEADAVSSPLHPEPQ